MEGVLLVIIMYLIFHLPAILMLIVGLSKRKKNPEKGKGWLIIAGIYFLIGGGICGALLI